MALEQVSVRTKFPEFAAVQFDGTADNAREIRQWVRGFGGTATFLEYKLYVQTPEETKMVKLDDWVVCIETGVFYIFTPIMFIKMFRGVS